jgi:predicted metal-dependent hydrolase
LLRLRLIRNRRARRYVLRLSRDGSARVAIPRGGSPGEAKRFAQENTAWLEKQLLRQAANSRSPQFWLPGTELLFRGQQVRLELGINGKQGTVNFGDQVLAVKDPTTDLRREVELHLRRLAAQELPARVRELAALHQIPYQRVTVRNQRSRWGSCSRRGTISLNWRLVQTPQFVTDYIILHELAHVKEMNHSSKFWNEVARLCPDFTCAEKWLKEHRLDLVQPRMKTDGSAEQRT